MIDRSVSSTRRAADGGAALDTVTADATDVLVFPDSSRATAVSACDPSATVVVFQLIAYGTAVASATGTPSTMNCTPTTATLSDASALTVAVPLTDAPSVGELTFTAGGVVSGGAPNTSNASTATRKSLAAAFFVR